MPADAFDVDDRYYRCLSGIKCRISSNDMLRYEEEDYGYDSTFWRELTLATTPPIPTDGTYTTDAGDDITYSYTKLER